MSKKMKRIMKNFMSFKAILAVSFLLVFSFACTDLTEETPSDITTLENEEQFVSALGEAYAILGQWSNHGGFFSLQQISTDETVIPRRGGDWFDGGIWLDAHQHTTNAEHGPTNGSWNYLFSGVNATSRLILQFETLIEEGQAEPELAEPFISEMKVMRAFYYFWLLDMFGNVPIIENFAEADANPSNNSDFQAGRTEVFEFVEQSLLDNVDDISDDPGASYGRVNKYAAHFLLAKLYLNAEVFIDQDTWNGTNVYELAEEQLDIIIDSGLFSLEGNYFNNFATNNEGASETIFAIPYDEVFLEGFQMHHMTLHYAQQAQFDFQDQPWNGYATLAEFYNSFEEGDIRQDGLMAGLQRDLNGDPLIDEDAPGDPELSFDVEIPAIDMPNQTDFPRLRLAGARFNKFEYEIGATPHLNNDYPVMRYADVILMKAEAMWRQNGDGQMYFDMIRENGRVGDVDPITLNEENLLAERSRELYMEVYRRQDMIRFDRFNDEWWEKPESEPFRNVFPIPQTQIDANPNLNQNPGWN